MADTKSARFHDVCLSDWYDSLRMVFDDSSAKAEASLATISSPPPYELEPDTAPTELSGMGCRNIVSCSMV